MISNRYRTIFLSAYFLSAVFNIYAVYTQNFKMEVLFKSMLMPFLFLYFLTFKGVSGKVKIGIIAALLFSWAGDVSLLWTHLDELYFVVGLGSFLLAHICYIYTFWQARNESEINTKQSYFALRIFLLLIIGYGVFSIIQPGLGDMLIPVLVYMLVILFMAASSLLRKDKTSAVSFSIVYLASLIFIASDSILAVNKFSEPIADAGVWIMLTYVIAQVLIVLGISLHFGNQSK